MMEIKEFSAVQMTLLKLLEKDLFGTDYVPDEKTDWDTLFLESRQQAVTLHIYNAAGKYIPKEQAENWQKYALNQFRRNMMVHHDHTVLHELLTENKIPYCILKGCSSSYYYPDFCLRGMGDVDFLIRKEDIPRVTQLLESNGFKASGEDHSFHIIFRKERIYLEMHYAPPGVPEGRAGELVRSYLEDIFKKSETFQLESVVFQKPSDFHHGLIILMHTYSHLLAEGIGLRHLSDLAVFFDAFSDEEFTNIFYKKLSNAGIWRFTQIMACVSHCYLGLPYRSWMGKVDKGLCSDVMSDLLNSGNFGHKDKKRRDQGLLILHRGKNGIEKKSLFQIISVVDESARRNLPGLYKVKILIPLAWLVVCIRFTYHVATGKRGKLEVNTLFREAEQRKSIYKQFRLFETEEK